MPALETQPPGAPVWQRNYFERIVRNKAELVRIRDVSTLPPTRSAGPRPGGSGFPPRCFRMKGSRHSRDAGDSVRATPMHDAGTLLGRRGARPCAPTCRVPYFSLIVMGIVLTAVPGVFLISMTPRSLFFLFMRSLPLFVSLSFTNLV